MWVHLVFILLAAAGILGGAAAFFWRKGELAEALAALSKEKGVTSAQRQTIADLEEALKREGQARGRALWYAQGALAQCRAKGETDENLVDSLNRLGGILSQDPNTDPDASTAPSSGVPAKPTSDLPTVPIRGGRR